MNKFRVSWSRLGGQVLRLKALATLADSLIKKQDNKPTVNVLDVLFMLVKVHNPVLVAHITHRNIEFSLPLLHV